MGANNSGTANATVMTAGVGADPPAKGPSNFPLIASALVGAIGNVGSTYSASQAIRANTGYQRNVANINKNYANLYADLAIKKGEKNAALVRKNVRQTTGAQRAALAAQGIDIDTGSATDILADTRAQGNLDVMTVKNNAWLESWGYKVAAQEASAKGEFASIAGRFEENNTLLTGGVNALHSGLKTYAAYKKV